MRRGNAIIKNTIAILQAIPCYCGVCVWGASQGSTRSHQEAGWVSNPLQWKITRTGSLQRGGFLLLCSLISPSADNFHRQQWKGFFVCFFLVSNSTLFVVCFSFTLAALNGNRGSTHTRAKMQPSMEINHGINVLRNHRIHELRNHAIHVLRNHRTHGIHV